MSPIGIIMVPTFDVRRYSGLPLSSTLNGSCTNVCPVKINIHEQIVRSPLGVAETGSVLLSEEEYSVNTIGSLAHDIGIT
jgi:L-lactate utilization protein LutB